MRHRGNVRLCDRTTHCHERWPCPVHGTLRAGTPLDLAAAASTLCALKGVKRAVADAATCCGCGRHVCSCAKPEPARAQPETGQRFKVGDRVRCINARQRPPLRHGAEYTVRLGGNTYVDVVGISETFYAERFELVTPAPEKPAAEGLPRGWYAPAKKFYNYTHTSGALCWDSECGWFYARFGDKLGTRADSMLTAMAAALSLEIEPYAGGYVWRHKGLASTSAVYPTPDACAAAALEAHG